MTEMEPPLAQLFLERVMRSDDERNKENETLALDMLVRPLNALEDYLSSSAWLIAEKFTVADLNLASILTLMNRTRFDLTDWETAFMQLSSLI